MRGVPIVRADGERTACRTPRTVRPARVAADDETERRKTMQLPWGVSLMLNGVTAEQARPLTGATSGVSVRLRERLVKAVMQQGFRAALSRQNWARSGDRQHGEPVDLLFAGPGEPRLPDEVFARLRWGGRFVCVGTSSARIDRIAAEFDQQRGFVLEEKPNDFWLPPMGLAGFRGLRLPGFSTRGHYFVARKTHLVPPGEFTERFTYQVELLPDERAEEGYVVSKRVPTYDELLQKLRQKFPKSEPRDLEKRAHKLVDHVFPTFLTREAAILKILQRELPEPFRQRVPRPLAIEQDERGFVRHLKMSWLRVGGEPMSQLDFARQAAELLYILHEKGRVMHLDLRMDNMVISHGAVCFVDFGSAVRIGENLKQSSMLDTLFSEMMRTSHIQRMLGKMLETGECTNTVMREVHGRVDKTVDAFYLAVQIAKPDTHPELKHLIRFESESEQARLLRALTAAILRPKTPGKEAYRSVADILRGIRRIEQKLGDRPEPRLLRRAA